MATMVTQVNGMPVSSAVQPLGVEIPHLEVSYQNEHSIEDRRGQAPTVSRHTKNTSNTGHGLEGSHNENKQSRNVIGDSQHCDLRDDFNSWLCGRDIRDRINECRAECAHNSEDNPLYLRQRCDDPTRPDPTGRQISYLFLK